MLRLGDDKGHSKPAIVHFERNDSTLSKGSASFHISFENGVAGDIEGRPTCSTTKEAATVANRVASVSKALQG